MTDKFYGFGYVASDEPQEQHTIVNAPALSNFKKVHQFMTVFQQECPDFPAFPSEQIQQLRVDLIDEEFNELKQAIAENDIVAAADALSDLLYVVYGTGVAFGIPLDECFAEVHDSNMSKLGPDGQPIRREDGKVLKGPDYFKPDLFPILFPSSTQPYEAEVMSIISLTPREDGLYDIVMRDVAGVDHVFEAKYDEGTESLQLL